MLVLCGEGQVNRNIVVNTTIAYVNSNGLPVSKPHMCWMTVSMDLHDGSSAHS